MVETSHSILVVEDNKDLLNLLVINLTDQGIREFLARVKTIFRRIDASIILKFN